MAADEAEPYSSALTAETLRDGGDGLGALLREVADSYTVAMSLSAEGGRARRARRVGQSGGHPDGRGFRPAYLTSGLEDIIDRVRAERYSR